jgi:hypothetical protein
LECRTPQPRQRWMIAQSPPGRAQTAIGSMELRHSDARSPGSSSKCLLQRQWGQWFRCAVPVASGVTGRPQWTQANHSGAASGRVWWGFSRRRSRESFREVVWFRDKGR